MNRFEAMISALDILRYRPVVHGHAICIPNSNTVVLDVLQYDAKRVPMMHPEDWPERCIVTLQANLELIKHTDAWGLRTLSQAQLESLSVAVDQQLNKGAGNA